MPRQSRDYGYAADDLLVHGRGDRRVRGNEDIHPRSELHHAESIARLHLVAFLDAADDASREDADNLPDDNRLPRVIDGDLRVFIEVARLGLVRRQETAGMI